MLPSYTFSLPPRQLYCFQCHPIIIQPPHSHTIHQDQDLSPPIQLVNLQKKVHGHTSVLCWWEFITTNSAKGAIPCFFPYLQCHKGHHKKFATESAYFRAITKVYEFDSSCSCEQNILPLDVSVQNSTGVQVDQSSKNFPHDVGNDIF